LINQYLCDSIIRLDLAILPVDTTDISESICQGSTYDFFGTDLSEAGIYEHVLINQYLCDSIIRLELELLPLPETPMLSLSNDTIYSSADSGNQWYFDYNEIVDANSDYYFPEEDGEYFVIVTGDNGCLSDTSNIILVNWVGVDLQENMQIAVYPNPFKARLHIEADNGEFVYYELFNMLGVKIDSGEFMHKTAISTTNLKPSSYLLRLTVGETVKTIKVIKQ
jgi:hypothetical protein